MAAGLSVFFWAWGGAVWGLEAQEIVGRNPKKQPEPQVRWGLGKYAQRAQTLFKVGQNGNQNRRHLHSPRNNLQEHGTLFLEEGSSASSTHARNDSSLDGSGARTRPLGNCTPNHHASGHVGTSGEDKIGHLWLDQIRVIQ